MSVSSEEPTLITPPRKKNKLPPAVSSDESIDTPKSPLPKKKKGGICLKGVRPGVCLS